MHTRTREHSASSTGPTRCTAIRSAGWSFRSAERASDRSAGQHVPCPPAGKENEVVGDPRLALQPGKLFVVHPLHHGHWAVRGFGEFDDGFTIDGFLVYFDVTAMHRYIPGDDGMRYRRLRASSRASFSLLPPGSSGDYRW